MKKLIPLILISCIMLTGCYAPKNISTDIDNYSKDCDAVMHASELMPDISELGDYTDLKYTYCHSSILGLESDGLALFVKYSQETYAKEKQKLLTSYTFLEEPVIISDRYVIPLAEFEYKDYRIKVVPDDAYTGMSSCKSFMMLGVNDDKCAVTYLYFYDPEIDCIATAKEDRTAEMIDFIDENFSWVEF